MFVVFDALQLRIHNLNHFLHDCWRFWVLLGSLPFASTCSLQTLPQAASWVHFTILGYCRICSSYGIHLWKSSKVIIINQIKRWEVFVILVRFNVNYVYLIVFILDSQFLRIEAIRLQSSYFYSDCMGNVEDIHNSWSSFRIWNPFLAS